ncbi:hypothetical protein AAFF_G00249010 [Aldrovandia affinis]|uniref:Uncharacterized protein n=1 Tax=Aldrovandia affinis TaxID=143900 RepID=A0AAD7RDQ7_9TELE|nr:hypothetical protein AAFF_G00249010 [Aldrovandia affinis]
MPSSLRCWRPLCWEFGRGPCPRDSEALRRPSVQHRGLKASGAILPWRRRKVNHCRVAQGVRSRRAQCQDSNTEAQPEACGPVCLLACLMEGLRGARPAWRRGGACGVCRRRLALGGQSITGAGLSLIKVPCVIANTSVRRDSHLTGDETNMGGRAIRHHPHSHSYS